MTEIEYSSTLRIKNVNSLSAGSGCKFLLVIKSHVAGEFIAKKWCRKRPEILCKNEVLIKF